jgi:hypothetical protein
MIRLGLISCLGAALVLPACIVTHGLGETADEGTGSGEGSAGETDTDADPSATGEMPGTTDPSATGEVPGTTDPSDTATDGEPDTGNDTGDMPHCEPSPEHMAWSFNGASFAPLAGIEASFLAILDGDCIIGEITEVVPEDGDTRWTIPLQCAAVGQIDGDAAFAGEVSPVIELRGNVSFGEIVQLSGLDVRLKLVLDWWGMGWNGWVVLEFTNGDGIVLLDLVNAEYVDPIESTWVRQVGNVLPGPWRKNTSVSVIDDQCGGPVGKCGDEPHALRFGIGPDSPLTLHEGQEGTMSNVALLHQYRVSVTSARENPMPTCTDTPLGAYAFVAWYQEQ